jgi:peptidoglycan hydrolase-like protein with peptidoglycan-binding domain
VRQCIWKGARDSNSGDSVSELINVLHSNGYAPKNEPKVDMDAPGKYDKVFGQNIHDAVVRFQQAHNIKPDGIVGPDTWAAMGAGSWASRADCPRCAGNYPFGGSPPYDCSSARPPTQQELEDRAKKAEELTGKQWVPGGGEVTPGSDDTKAPASNADDKGTNWWLIGGISAGVLALSVGGYYVWKSKQK